MVVAIVTTRVDVDKRLPILTLLLDSQIYLKIVHRKISALYVYKNELTTLEN